MYVYTNVGSHGHSTECQVRAIIVIVVVKRQHSNSRSCGGRVVKAMDLKSIRVSLRRFKSCPQRRKIFLLFFPSTLKVYNNNTDTLGGTD